MRFTEADWPDTIVPTLERELGTALASKVIAHAQAAAGPTATTGLLVRALIRTRRPAVLQALDVALKEIASR